MHPWQQTGGHRATVALPSGVKGIFHGTTRRKPLQDEERHTDSDCINGPVPAASAGGNPAGQLHSHQVLRRAGHRVPAVGDPVARPPQERPGLDRAEVVGPSAVDLIDLRRSWTATPVQAVAGADHGPPVRRPWPVGSGATVHNELLPAVVQVGGDWWAPPVSTSQRHRLGQRQRIHQRCRARLFTALGYAAVRAGVRFSH